MSMPVIAFPDAIEAFSSQDVQLARDTPNRAKTIDGRHNRIFHELVEGRDDSLSPCG